jgi:hypothetical protein
VKIILQYLTEFFLVSIYHSNLSAWHPGSTATTLCSPGRQRGSDGIFTEPEEGAFPSTIQAQQQDLSISKNV